MNTDEIYNMTPKTFKDHVLHYLVTSGMWADQAEAVFDLYEVDMPEMNGIWNDNVAGYPPQMIAVTLLGLDRIAYKYVKENCPNAWYKPMFEK